MALHCQLLFSTVLYLSAFICGLIITVCLAIIKANVSGKCFLFMDDKQKTLFLTDEGAGKVVLCDFELYLPTATLLYALIMTGYHGYASLVSFREQHIGRTMWIMPWLLLNSLITLVTFVAACIFSVGFHVTCIKLTSDNENIRCSKKFTEMFKSIKFTSFDNYDAVMVVQFAYWTSVAVWIAILIVSILRLLRNIRARSAVNFSETTSDTAPISEMVPSA